MIRSFKIFEKLQQADKLYFKTNIISEEDKNMILSITHGDNYTKPICDLFLQVKRYMHYKIEKELTKLYDQLREYDKFLFPIKNFDINNLKYSELEIRQKLLDNLRQLPSIGIRNLKHEIRQERDYSEMMEYENLFTYFIGHLNYIHDNENPIIKQKIYQKMFKSGVTMNALTDFVEEKSNLIDGNPITREFVENLIDTYYESFEKVYDENNIMVVEVSSQFGIKTLGCNSLWCFTYGDSNYQQWNSYSYNGLVYVIINFNEPTNTPDFMYVLISPLKKKYDEDGGDGDSPLFDMTNSPIDDPLRHLKYIFGKFNFRKLFTFNY